MRTIYFLTIDKVKDLHIKPTPKMLIEVRNELLIKIQGFPINPYKVDCFELKQDKKNGDRLHYHMQFYSYSNFISYKQAKKDGWSIKIKKLNTPYDIANNAGYIQKHKIDKCRLIQMIRNHQWSSRDTLLNELMK